MASLCPQGALGKGGGEDAGRQGGCLLDTPSRAGRSTPGPEFLLLGWPGAVPGEASISETS